jgi:hypothetical protein
VPAITAQAQFYCATNNGTISITGYYGSGGDVTIPGVIGGLPVTSIAAGAFLNQTTINVVTVPDSVTNIGASAFEGCVWIFGVNLPTNIPTIGDDTFYQCFQLVGINLPNTVTNIGNDAFYSCASLLEIAIPDSVKDIGNSAFYGCWRLGQVSVGNGVGSIGDTAFHGCVALTNLTLGDGITNIGQAAFESCSNLPSVILPKSLTTMGDYAFDGCPRMRAIYFLGNALTNLSLYSFVLPDNNAPVYYLSGTSGWGSTFQYHSTVLWDPQVEMNDGMSGAGPNGFRFRIIGGTNLPVVVEACTNLAAPVWQPLATNILADGAADFLDSDSTNHASRFYRFSAARPGDFDFTVTNGTITLTAYYGGGGDVTIPSVLGGLPVTSIASRAFWENQDVAMLSIPESVTNIGSLAFFGCVNLRSVEIENGVVGPSAFSGCGALTNIVLGKGVTAIEDSAFEGCTSLGSIEIANSVTNIATGSAFMGCGALTNFTVDAGNPVYASVDGVLFDSTETTLLAFPFGRGGSYAIPDGVTKIGNGSFDTCVALTNVEFPASLLEIGDSAFYYCTGLTNIIIPNGVTNIGNNAFEVCFDLARLVLGTNLVEIGSNAFADCSDLTNVTIPNSIINIDDSAFNNCTNLSNVSLGLNVQQIGPGAFAGCSFSSITVPATVTNIGPNAFGGVSAINVALGNLVYSSIGGVLFNSNQTTLLIYPPGGLRDYTIPGGVTKIGDFAFEDSGITNVTMPASLVEIGTNAFANCFLTSVSIPDGVKLIDEGAFSHCWARTVTVGNGVTNIEDSAFISCGMTNIILGKNVSYLGLRALSYSFALQGAYFTGNAPATGGYVFDADPPGMTVYYEAGTTGWGQYFEGEPTAVWQP